MVAIKFPIDALKRKSLVASPFCARNGFNATRQLHGANRFEGPAQSADALSSLRRREAWLGTVSYQFDRRMRAHLSDAGMGSDRAATLAAAFDGSRAAKVP